MKVMVNNFSFSLRENDKKDGEFWHCPCGLVPGPPPRHQTRHPSRERRRGCSTSTGEKPQSSDHHPGIAFRELDSRKNSRQ